MATDRREWLRKRAILLTAGGFITYALIPGLIAVYVLEVIAPPGDGDVPWLCAAGLAAIVGLALIGLGLADFAERKGQKRLHGLWVLVGPATQLVAGLIVTTATQLTVMRSAEAGGPPANPSELVRGPMAIWVCVFLAGYLAPYVIVGRLPDLGADNASPEPS